MPTDQEKPKCPYNCPYKPSNEERPDVEDPVSESEIEACPNTDSMTAVIRSSDYEGDVHIKTLWQTQFGPKVGIKSDPEYADVFNRLDWEIAHHKWNSQRTKGTEMWEVDLDALMYVCFFFVEQGVDVTIEDDIREKYIDEMEDVPVQD